MAALVKETVETYSNEGRGHVEKADKYAEDAEPSSKDGGINVENAGMLADAARMAAFK